MGSDDGDPSWPASLGFSPHVHLRQGRGTHVFGILFCCLAGDHALSLIMSCLNALKRSLA